MLEKINIGDTVCIKAGNRKMQVHAINGAKITCRYANVDKLTQEVVVPNKMLEKYNKNCELRNLASIEL